MAGEGVEGKGLRIFPLIVFLRLISRTITNESEINLELEMETKTLTLD